MMNILIFAKKCLRYLYLQVHGIQVYDLYFSPDLVYSSSPETPLDHHQPTTAPPDASLNTHVIRRFGNVSSSGIRTSIGSGDLAVSTRRHCRQTVQGSLSCTPVRLGRRIMVIVKLRPTSSRKSWSNTVLRTMNEKRIFTGFFHRLLLVGVRISPGAPLAAQCDTNSRGTTGGKLSGLKQKTETSM